MLDMSLKHTYVRLQPHLPGTNELSRMHVVSQYKTVSIIVSLSNMSWLDLYVLQPSISTNVCIPPFPDNLGCLQNIAFCE